MSHIHSLSLTSFRNYDSAFIDKLSSKFVVLIGENGAGKTNCLEAVSLLSPGRGLRGATVEQCQSQKNPSLWAVSSTITDSDNYTNQLGVGRNPQKIDKKIIRYNGDTLKSQSELGEIMRAVWLTPQMDGLFLSGSSERRRFFDRLVASFDAAHTGRTTRYERAMRERLTLLKKAIEKNVAADETWLRGLESVMAETGVAIAAARIDMLSQLQGIIDTTPSEYFPCAAITLIGDMEKWLTQGSALNAEDQFKDTLLKTRGTDGITGRTQSGAHRTDMSVTHKQKLTPAQQCSTGEQKGLLTSIILAHATLVRIKYGAPPLLLFDEITAHFDEKRRDALFNILSNLGGQVWLTGQDKNAFSNVQDKQLISIENNQLIAL
jgi:DNA replication and repair protein RecF